jgi:hypothetical protein
MIGRRRSKVNRERKKHSVHEKRSSRSKMREREGFLLPFHFWVKREKKMMK